MLKGVGKPKCHLGGDFHSTNEVKGTLEANNDDKAHHLTAEWLKEGVKTAFTTKTCVEQCMGKLQDMMGRQFAEWKTPMAESAHPNWMMVHCSTNGTIPNSGALWDAQIGW